MLSWFTMSPTVPPIAAKSIVVVMARWLAGPIRLSVISPVMPWLVAEVRPVSKLGPVPVLTRSLRPKR